MWGTKSIIINFKTHPEERVQRSILHELSDDHDRAAFCHHALQVDDVGVIKLAHDAGFAQEVPPLLFSVARLQCLDGYQDLSLSRQAQVSAAHLPKLTWRKIRCSTWLIQNLFPTFSQCGLEKSFLPAPMTCSIFTQDMSISLANSRTASLGSSYVKGSI